MTTIEIFAEPDFKGESLTLAIGRYNRAFLTENSQDLKSTISSVKIPKKIVVNITTRQASDNSVTRAIFHGDHANILELGLTDVIEHIEVIPFIRSTGSFDGEVRVNYRSGPTPFVSLKGGDNVIEGNGILSITVRPATLAIFYDGAHYRKAERSFAVKGPITLTDPSTLDYKNVFIIPLDTAPKTRKKVSINSDEIDAFTAKEVREEYKSKASSPTITICIVIFVILLAILIAVKVYRAKKSESASTDVGNDGGDAAIVLPIEQE